MRCWWRLPSGSDATCAKPTCCRGSPATNSCCCSARSRASTRSRNTSARRWQRLTAPFFIDGSEIFASTSIGVSLYPDHGTSYDVLCQNADIAMYRVKSDGKGAVAFFNASMEREAQARMKVEQSLRLAILEKRFCCAFQTKVDIRTRGHQGHRGAGAPARRRRRDSGPGHLHQPRGGVGADRRTHFSGAGGDRQVDRSDQRDLRPRDHDQHQRRGQAGR